MRNRKKGKKDNKDAKDLFADNAFKAQPAGKWTNSLRFILEAEFVVVRRESFGQVAKEHTQKIMKESVNKNAW